MKFLASQTKLLILFSVVLLFAGCKQPETIVIDDTPTTAAPEDTTTEDQTPGNQASFRQLVIGEHNAIKSMDPLFVENLSEMRAVQLVYEGLVRLDEDGYVVSGIARDWSVGNDSLRYTFTLQPNIFYQDSEVFSTGTGRKLTSEDVKFVFERMARSGVPPTAAQMFMDIDGFEPYYQEQHFVYNPKNRELNGVSGIQTPNDSTVVFQLVNKDPNFLKKLATPLAVIYPREAVGRNLESFTPVGAGPFVFSQGNSDSTYIFSKFRNYYAAPEINLNRVDVRTSTSESQLFKSMESGDIQLLPQLGPQLLENLLAPEGDLKPSYSDRYDLQKTNGTTEYILHYNPGSDLSASAAKAIAGYIQSDSGSFFGQLPDDILTSENTIDTVTSTNINQEIYSTYSEDPYVRSLLETLSSTLSDQNIKLQVMRIRAPSRNTALFFTQNYPLISDGMWADSTELYSFSIRQTALLHSEIQGLNFNQYPWWLNLRGVTLPAVENL